jgi:uncharacterized protein with NRDE domain
MCTLILLDRVVPGFPLVVAANRDEFFARPSASPAVFRAREEGRADFVAPQDLEAGGTWMGVNSHGLFVGLTNRSEQNLDPDRRSRGLLVRDRLGCRNASEAIEELGDPTGIYNPFFLAVADGRETWWVAGRPEGAEVRQLEPGIHVAGNRDVDDPSSTKVREIHGAVKAIDLAAPFGEVVRGLVDVLSAHPHTGQPVETACVHTPEYGTRSASVIALGPQRRGYWATDGAPCKAKFQDCTRLLDEIQLV